MNHKFKQAEDNSSFCECGKARSKDHHEYGPISCHYGSLERSCYICDLEDEIQKLKKDFEIMRDIAIEARYEDTGNLYGGPTKYIDQEFENRRNRVGQ